MSAIRLVPMTTEEFDQFLERSIPNYAEAHVRAGRWTPAESLEKSRKEHLQILSKGLATPDQYLWTVRDEKTGGRVGEAWCALQRQEGWPQLFIYWIGIDESQRRHGYGIAVMEAFDAEAARLGAARLALHVFGDNAGARRLYEKAGYQDTNIIMTKPVGPRTSETVRPT